MIIDNDEIAAVTWLWGGPYNQIATADLGGWNPAYFSFRDTEPHHGDDPNNGGLGWWDYRGSITTPPTSGRPYIDLQFAGYEEFLAYAYPNNVSWSHMDLGDDIHRFILEDPEWVGNFDLWVRSSITQERRIDAWVGGGGVDVFDLAPNTNGLAFEDGNRFAQVFGPIPTPSTLLLLAAGLLGWRISCPRRQRTADGAPTTH